MNFANLRNKVSEKEKEIEEINKSIEDKISVVKNEVLESVMKDHYNETLKRLAGDDKDLLEKVELQYKRLTDTAGTREEISKKLNDAYILATGGTSVSDNDNSAFSSGGVGDVKSYVKDPDKKLSDDEKDLLNKLSQAGGLNIKSEDLEGK